MDGRPEKRPLFEKCRSTVNENDVKKRIEEAGIALTAEQCHRVEEFSLRQVASKSFKQLSYTKRKSSMSLQICLHVLESSKMRREFKRQRC